MFTCLRYNLGPFLAGFFCLGISASQAGEIDATQSLQLLDHSLQSIHSFDVTFDVTTRFMLVSQYEMSTSDGRTRPVVKSRRKLTAGETPNTVIDSYREFFSRGRGRVDFLDKNSGKPTTLLVYDGEVEKTWAPGQAQVMIRAPMLSRGEGVDYLESLHNISMGACPLSSV
jgi:hypothetical protein